MIVQTPSLTNQSNSFALGVVRWIMPDLLYKVDNFAKAYNVFSQFEAI